MPCHLCQRVQTDPVRGASPWARGVSGGEQILVCPECQARDASWTELLQRCPRCSGTRLSIVLGSVVCRECGAES